MTEAPVGTWGAVRLVTVREITARTSSKVYRISSIIMVLAVVTLLLLGGWIYALPFALAAEAWRRR